MNSLVQDGWKFRAVNNKALLITGTGRYYVGFERRRLEALRDIRKFYLPERRSRDASKLAINENLIVVPCLAKVILRTSYPVVQKIYILNRGNRLVHSRVLPSRLDGINRSGNVKRNVWSLKRPGVLKRQVRGDFLLREFRPLSYCYRSFSRSRRWRKSIRLLNRCVPEQLGWILWSWRKHRSFGEWAFSGWFQCDLAT